MAENHLDTALAALCEATREAVAELEEDSFNAFDGCPLCGRPSYMHPAESASVSVSGPPPP